MCTFIYRCISTDINKVYFYCQRWAGDGCELFFFILFFIIWYFGVFVMALFFFAFFFFVVVVFCCYLHVGSVNIRPLFR